ncbi:MAG: hypothetical protein WBC44_08495 [Planctomycetaceae bacterium]
MRRHAFPILAIALVATAGWWMTATALPEDASTTGPVEAGRPPRVAPRKPIDVQLSDGPVAAPELVAADGFEATIFAGDELVHDAGCLTIDEAGRIAVSGPGYIRLLVDHNRDGRADEGVTFADGPRTGAQGLCFDGHDLLAVGDGGLLRYRDLDGDRHADGPPVRLLPLKTGGEHHAHAIRRGPDGWWYLICGNDTGVTARTITSPTSPVLEPEAGVLLRFHYVSDENVVRDVEVVADGLRNAYDFDFTAGGDPVTYDSDDEREVSLPWYRPTRVFRLTPGSHAGWISRSWKRPDAFPEMPEVLASLGRGSPTGVLVARHQAWPPPFRNAVIVCDWTFGRVVAIPMDDRDRPGRPIELLTASGTAGFAPTDVAAAPDGSLLISAGGRGTTGTVYRLQYTGRVDAGSSPSAVDAASSQARRKALEELAESLSLRENQTYGRSLVELVVPALSEGEPNLRKAAMHVVSRLSNEALAELEARADAAGPTTAVRFHLGRLRRNRNVDLKGLTTAVETLEVPEQPADIQYDAVRLAQLALGDVGPAPGTPDTFSGYAARADLAEWQFQFAPWTARLAALYPTDHREVDREFVRLLAMLQADDAGLERRIIDRMTKTSHPTDDLHLLFALSRFPSLRSSDETDRIAAALVGLDAKCEARGLRLDNNWEERLGDLVIALVTADRQLPAAIVRHDDFGRPGHALLVEVLPKSLHNEATVAFVRAADADSDYRWTPALVALLGESDDPAMRDRLRSLFDEPTVQTAVVAALAEHPDEADRSAYVAGLAEPDVEIVDRCVAALERLAPATEPAELAALTVALRRLDRDEREYAVRDRVAQLLKRAIGDDFGFVSGKDGFRSQPECVERFVSHVRAIAPDLVPAEQSVGPALQSLLAEASRLGGDAMRGRAFFEAKSCHRCHDGAAVGPDLAGVFGRFSRDDLFLAIADSDRNVSERYRGTLVLTTDGQVATGLVVYESADGVTLKDGTRTWRIEADEIAQRRPLDVSLMPRGLLNDATPQNLADLEAYLRTLGQ